jgi:hypothetical protein
MSDDNPSLAERVTRQREMVQQAADKMASARYAADEASARAARAGPHASLRCQEIAANLARAYSEAKAVWTEASRLLVLLEGQERFREQQDAAAKELGLLENHLRTF